jgi:glycosyltransferase involved in cell wall biosynthesis
MSSLGHEVIVYASEDNEAACTEFVTVISKAKQREFFGDYDHKKNFFNLTWNPKDKHWKYMNTRAIKAIQQRIQPQDFICLIGGVCQREIADEFPRNMSVEYGIGYTGTFSKYRVFESYAHMHYVHGDQRDDNGNFYDTVIPNYYEPSEFPFSRKRGDYFLYMGRLIDRKGYHIAQEVCARLGKKLILAGQGECSGYGEHVGVVDAKRRGELMSRALATFVPTTYMEPFGGVHAESLLCGTPVITTNFGVFTETVQNGVNGWRCDVFRDFVQAAQDVQQWHEATRLAIREDAQQRFGLAYVKQQYQAYFQRLLDLWDRGWYQMETRV